MSKGLLIFFTVLVCVGIVHWVSLYLIKTSGPRAKKLRTIFWHFYGILFLIFGLVRLSDPDSSNVSALIQAGLGLFVIILTSLGKMNEGVKE